MYEGEGTEVNEQLETLIEEIRGLRETMERSQGSDERPLTREAAAKFLDVHPDTLYRWAKEGQIAYSKLGDGERADMRFRLEDLQHFAFDRRKIGAKDTYT